MKTKLVKNTIFKNKNNSKGVSSGTKKQSTRGYLIRRIIVTNLLSLTIVVLTYLWIVYFLSNVSSFWDLFRGKDVYEQKDTIAPFAPFLDQIPEATQDTTITVSGRAEPGVQVTLFVDGSKLSDVTSDSEGLFAFTNVPVGQFKESIYAMSIDTAGNESEKSLTYYIQQDKEPPELEITTPKDGDTYKSTGHSYKVTGKTEPGSTVIVNNQLALINPNGEFSTSLRLEEGDNEITVLAKDKALNENKQVVHIRFEKID